MKFTVEINIDNAAFHNDVVLLGDDEATHVLAPFLELRRILNERLPDGGEIVHPVPKVTGTVLKDINGSTVGHWEIRRED